MHGFSLTRGQKSDFNIVFFVGAGRGETSGNICEVNSSHFRGFFTGSDSVKNALFTGFEIFYPAREKHCESSEVFYRFFTGSFTGFFTG